MSSAYRLHPASRYSSPSKLHHKVGVALAFIAFGSIAGASGFMLQMAGPEPFSSGSPALVAASPNPGTAHAASPAAPPPPAVSAPTAPPSAPAQAAPAAAMIAAAPEPARWRRPRRLRQRRSPRQMQRRPRLKATPRRRRLPPGRRRKKQRAARAGATAAGTTPMRGARVRITGAAATIIGGRSGDVT